MKTERGIESKMDARITCGHNEPSQISVIQQDLTRFSPSGGNDTSNTSKSSPTANTTPSARTIRLSPVLCTSKTDAGFLPRTFASPIRDMSPKRTSLSNRHILKPLQQQSSQEPYQSTSEQVKQDLIYLKEHKVCETLEFIVKSLLLEQPEDPILAICNMLRQSNRSGSSVRVSVNQGIFLQPQHEGRLCLEDKKHTISSCIGPSMRDACGMNRDSAPHDDIRRGGNETNIIMDKGNSSIRKESSQSLRNLQSQMKALYTHTQNDEIFDNDNSVDGASISHLLSHVRSEMEEDMTSLDAEEVATDSSETPHHCQMPREEKLNLEETVRLRDVSSSLKRNGNCNNITNDDRISVATGNDSYDDNTLSLGATIASTCITSSETANKLTPNITTTSPISITNNLSMLHYYNSVALLNRSFNSRVNTPSSSPALGQRGSLSVEPTSGLIRNSRLEREDSTKSEMSMFSVASVDMIEFLWEFRSAHASLFGLSSDDSGRPYISINDVADIVDRVSIPLLDVRLIVDLFNDLALKDAAYYYHRYKNIENYCNSMNFSRGCDEGISIPGDEEHRGTDNENDYNDQIKDKYGVSFDVIQQAAQGGHEPGPGLVSFDAFIARMNYKIQGRYPVELLRTVFFSMVQTSPSPNGANTAVSGSTIANNTNIPLPPTPGAFTENRTTSYNNVSDSLMPATATGSTNPRDHPTHGMLSIVGSALPVTTGNSPGFTSAQLTRSGGFTNRVSSTGSSMDLYVHFGGSTSGSCQAASTSSLAGMTNGTMARIPPPLSLSSLNKSTYIITTISNLSNEALWAGLGMHHTKNDIEKALSRLNITHFTPCGAAEGLGDEAAAPKGYDEGCEVQKDAAEQYTCCSTLTATNAAELPEECVTKDMALLKMGQGWEPVYKLNVNDFIKLVQYICTLHPEIT
eukprot:Tbor_TRINITY_DN5334_c1_g1::TRINITY_DN5334_c1_g1_i1::g.4587::m.4587